MIFHTNPRQGLFQKDKIQQKGYNDYELILL